MAYHFSFEHGRGSHHAPHEDIQRPAGSPINIQSQALQEMHTTLINHALHGVFDGVAGTRGSNCLVSDKLSGRQGPTALGACIALSDENIGDETSYLVAQAPISCRLEPCHNPGGITLREQLGPKSGS